MMQAIHVYNHTTPEALYPFDARGIAKRFRHAAIFGALDALQPVETMRFCNDHDPLPLLAQLQARYGEHLDIEYKQRRRGRVDLDGFMTDGRVIAIEVKKPSERKKVTYEQRAYLDQVAAAGGISGVACSVKEALEIVEGRM